MLSAGVEAKTGIGFTAEIQVRDCCGRGTGIVAGAGHAVNSWSGDGSRENASPV
jgi:hypothetical protein